MTVTDVQAQTDRVDEAWFAEVRELARACLLYTSPSPRDRS